eukprot:c52173_g1_i1 orf=2-181(-)
MEILTLQKRVTSVLKMNKDGGGGPLLLVGLWSLLYPSKKPGRVVDSDDDQKNSYPAAAAA